MKDTKCFEFRDFKSLEITRSIRLSIQTDSYYHKIFAGGCTSRIWKYGRTRVSSSKRNNAQLRLIRGSLCKRSQPKPNIWRESSMNRALCALMNSVYLSSLERMGFQEGNAISFTIPSLIQFQSVKDFGNSGVLIYINMYFRSYSKRYIRTITLHRFPCTWYNLKISNVLCLWHGNLTFDGAVWGVDRWAENLHLIT